MTDAKTFVFLDSDSAHSVGKSECRSGWCGLEYPKSCQRSECDGLVHANFGDEDTEGYWLYTACDKCGESEE